MDVTFKMPATPRAESSPISDDELIGQVAPLTSGFEGFRAKPYKDTAGNLTVGYGTNLDSPSAKNLFSKAGLDVNKARKNGVSKSEAEALLKAGLQVGLSDAKALVPNFDSLPIEAKQVILDMSYNLGGPKLEEFEMFREALNRNDFATAAAEMVNSKWYRQTGNRSRALVSKMKALSQRIR